MFFFFKQKTAYEMRIIDWSSDVCSSDLAAGRGSDRLEILHARGRHLFDEAVVREGPGRGHAILVEIPAFAAGDPDGVRGGGDALGLEEIGRASCRERVCTYV